MREASDANPSMTKPKYVQALLSMTDVANNRVDVGAILTHMEMKGWQLVSIVPIYGIVLVVWRGEVALPEFVEVGSGEDPTVSRDSVGPNGAVGEEG